MSVDVSVVDVDVVNPSGAVTEERDKDNNAMGSNPRKVDAEETTAIAEEAEAVAEAVSVF